jgi:hypothetical protein
LRRTRRAGEFQIAIPSPNSEFTPAAQSVTFGADIACGTALKSPAANGYVY